MDDYQPGGLVPPPATWAELSARVVFVPLGYGPKVAARAARLALLQGVEAAEAYVAAAARGAVNPGDAAPS
ncbi:hypothetical protein M4J06_000387 [Streptomyces coelicoflavus]|uniref:hypothetical protein n=1 Tax=Streptomyces TaxID=1883 RepID=UPI00210C12DF|nr:hypothetical protein [Streptomyces coelicoflavus]MCQ4203085.1 hypothetical protein [Streptomyces coelicoflavus]